MILLAWLLIPAIANGQAGFYVTPSFSVAEVYDDNLFSTASGRTTDFISRFNPGIQGGYESTPLTLLGRYTFDAEVYANHPDLNEAQVRQQAAIDFRYLPIKALTLSGTGTFTQTQTPRELNVETGVEAGRARARQFSAGPSISYQFDALTIGRGGYTFSRSEVPGGVTTDTHAGTLGFDRRFTPVDVGDLTYAIRYFSFEEDTTISHVVTLGWTRDLTPSTSVALRGGPRVSNGSWGAEALASITHKLDQWQFSFAYKRSQTTVVGQAGVGTTDGVTATVAYQPLRDLQVRASPAFFRTTRGGSETSVYKVMVDATYQILKWLSLTGSYQFSLQHGRLISTTGTADSSSGDIHHNIVMLRLVASYPYRVY